MNRSDDKPYKLLLGRVTGSDERLYIGRDHIMVVQGYYTETYRRFFFKDIQYVAYKKTSTGLVSNLILSFLAFIFFVIILSELPDTEDFGVLLFILGVILLFLIYNVWKGPTCKLVIVTATSKWILGNVGRIRRARKMLDRIVPEIIKAQGTMGELKARLDEAKATASSEFEFGEPGEIKPSSEFDENTDPEHFSF